jgi:RNA-directed DNA polymerase
LIENYPVPKFYKSLIEKFLKSDILHKSGFIEESVMGFPQGSVIGPSMANFVLNGLEELILPTQVTKVDIEKDKYFEKLGRKYSSSSSIIRKTLSNRIIRFADDFVIVTNDKEEAHLIYNKVVKLLNQRGLKLNEEKSKIFE